MMPLDHLATQPHPWGPSTRYGLQSLKEIQRSEHEILSILDQCEPCCAQMQQGCAPCGLRGVCQGALSFVCHRTQQHQEGTRTIVDTYMDRTERTWIKHQRSSVDNFSFLSHSLNSTLPTYLPSFFPTLESWSYGLRLVGFIFYERRDASTRQTCFPCRDTLRSGRTNNRHRLGQ